MKEHCVSGSIHLGDLGSQKIRKGTHRVGTSRNPIKEAVLKFVIQTHCYLRHYTCYTDGILLTN